MKRLYLLRHAKSSWDEPGLADRDRPLAPRGRTAAERMAEHLRSTGVRPDLVLCSSSRRTRETFAAVRSALGDPPVEIEDRLYAADADDLLARVREAPPDATSVMLIAHNPGIQDLAVELVREGEDLSRVREKFPTGALAVVAFDLPWAALGAGTVRLESFVVPRDLG
jgi:phosphohistidine phosphatase